MRQSIVFADRLLLPAKRVAVLSFKAAASHFRQFMNWARDAVERQTSLPEAFSSRRPCPECGGAMFYEPTPWSALTGKYLRTCEKCDYADARPVKIVQQI